jgi:spore coat protein JB
LLPEKDMVTRRSSSSNTCSDNNGTMPSCAPLAVPYVPFQQENSSVYTQNEALAQGTLFPGLNLPFYLKPDGEPVPVTPLTELQALDFVLSELGLYLDTHQGDSEAFALFQQYDELEREGRAKYQALYGPLTRGATAADNHYTWIHGPWPWEQKGEK